MTTTYTAVCEREGDWWVVTVPELESGGVTQARTLDEVPATVAETELPLTEPPAPESILKVAATGPKLFP